MPTQSDSRGEEDMLSLFTLHFHTLNYEIHLMTYCSIEALYGTAQKRYRSSTHGAVDVASFHTCPQPSLPVLYLMILDL